MLSERLIKTLARVVLASYATQLFAPLVHACEGEGLAARPANPSINNLQTRNTQPLSQAGLQDPLLSPVPFQDLPTLSFQLNALSSEANSGGGYRFSIEQTRISGGVTTLDHRWEQAFSLRDLASSQALAYPVNHPWMRYLSLHLSESGQLTAQSLSQPGGLYQGYNYVFNLEGDLHLSHLLTNGTIAVQEANQISAEGTVFAQKKMLLTARKGISTRSRDTQRPTLLLSDQEINLKGLHLDNENSRIKAPVIQGQLGAAGQGGISLNNTNGVIRAENLLDLYSATAIVNTGGVIGCQAGLAKIVGGSSLQNERGRIKGHQQLDLSLKEGLQNQGGQLRSQQKAILKLGSLDNKEGSIKTGGLLDLDVEKSITNTGGTIGSRSGQAKVNGLSLQNERGQIKGHQQLDLTIKKGIGNLGGQLWSQGDTTIRAYSLVNQKESEVKGRNLTISVTQALRTDDASSHLIADHVMRLTANTLYQASPFVAKTVYVNTINNLNLASAQFVETLSLSTENGPLNYRPNELQASHLLSVSLKNSPLTLTTPIKTPGAFEATAPEIINKTALAAQNEVSLTASSNKVAYPVRNEGDLVSATKGITIHADGFSHERGRVNSGGNFDFAGKNLRLRSSARIGGDIHIAAKGQRDIDFAQLEVQGTLHLTLLAGQVKLMQSITIPGQLELDRDGDNTEPFNLLVNLIAKKGLKIRLPSAPLIIGAEEERQPMVKLQAEEGSLDIQSKSLDIVKAQLFSRTRMRWEVQEKQIHIGRGIVSNTEQAFTYSGFRVNAGTRFSMMAAIGGAHPIRSKYANIIDINAACAANHLTFTNFFPFKHPNGTMVITEGPLTMIAPQGVLIDQAELETKGLEGWDVITRAPVRNEGGRIFIQGNVRIHGFHAPVDPKAILQNILPIQTSSWKIPISSFNHPFAHRGEVHIVGDLEASGLENVGSFIYVGGKILSPSGRSLQIIKKDFFPTIEGGLGAFFNPYLQENFPSIVSAAKGIVAQHAKNPQFEGVLQSSLIAIGFEGTARVGKLANYRRPPTPPFQQMKGFMDVHRPTALFQPALDAPTPWINQPTVPLTWDVTLPPAVGLGPTGLYLLGNEDKLLLHPLQEVDALPRVLSAQLQRGYLDAQHPDALATYIMGRHQAYSLYQKFFAPKALEGAAQPQTSSQNPEHALNAFSSTLVNTLSEEEVAQVKFMMLYYGMAYEGKTVHLPMSWISKQYDNPKLRNPDGGLFADIVLLKGLPGAKLECVSTIHGETLLGIDVSHTLLERQNYRYVTYHTNTTHKKGSWWRSDSHHSETVAMHHSEAQTNTGNLSTGTEGQMVLKGDLSIKGGSIEGGKKGITVDIPHLH
ncbi:MAG: filamentous hemagglutinin, partial [Alphaproteobacteria bacterium]|nr:filamentous hemagglutinin [Alphaproteobacteria bacterium]